MAQRDTFNVINRLYVITDSAPGVTNDESEGIIHGQRWIDTSASPRAEYVCLDASAGAAVWVKTTVVSAEQAPRMFRSRLLLAPGTPASQWVSPSGGSAYQQEDRATVPLGAGVISNVRVYLVSGLTGSQTVDFGLHRSQSGAIPGGPALSLTSASPVQQWIVAPGDDVTLTDNQTLAILWQTSEGSGWANQLLWAEMTFTPA